MHREMQAEEEQGCGQAPQLERSPRASRFLQEESLEQSWTEAARLEQALSQGLDVCKGCCQGKPSQLHGHKGTVEKQSLDLLQHQCQILKDQLFCYEEGTQELELSQQQEREQQRQEQLAPVKHRVSLLESMLGLYKKKYQASLGRAGELESQRQQLAEELATQAQVSEEAAFKTHARQLSLQEELQSRCQQLTRAEDTIARLVQELRGAQEELAQGQQYEETIQDLQEQLAASHTKFLDQEAALAATQKDFAAYKLAHTYSNSTYKHQAADTESLRQKLLQAEGKSSEHQQQAEQYQVLVQDLKRELVRVAEQKNRATEDVARLELDLRNLRQAAAAEGGKQQLEAAEERQRVQLLEAELQQSRQLCALKEQAAVREARQHWQVASQLEAEVESSQERLKGLQQQWQEEQQRAQSLQSTIMTQEAENQILREQLKQHATQLEKVRGSLEGLQLQLQQQTAEQEAALSQLHTELHRAQERERQSRQALAAAQDLAQDLRQQVASCQDSQRAALEQLEERGREVFRLHADLQLSQHKEAHLEEELVASRQQTQQLKSQAQALQRQREEEACSSEERQRERDQEAQHWQDKHLAAQQALADKEEELVVLKVELATLKEKWHAAAEEVQTLEGERAVTQRLLQESELMEANVSQWVKEQKQVKEKLSHKIREQITQIAQLTGERDHLQGAAERLQQENRQLKHRVEELHIEQERFAALHSKAWDPRAGQRQPWPGKSPRFPGQRQGKGYTAKWD